MVARFALVVVLAAAATMSSAYAADLTVAPSSDCNCGSTMITINAFEPGVVTRHWADCACRDEPSRRGRLHAAAPIYYPDDTPFMDPWRRW